MVFFFENMPKLPPLKEISPIDSKKTIVDTGGNCINNCDENFTSAEHTQQASYRSSEETWCSSPHDRSIKKSPRTSNMKSREALKSAGISDDCYLPTIAENKCSKISEHSNQSELQNISLSKLHEKSFNDRKSMAFWRRRDNDINESGRKFDRIKSVHLPPSSLFSQNTKPRF